MAKVRTRLLTLGLAAAMSVVIAPASVAAAAAAAAPGTCPPPSLSSVPCVIAVQNNTGSSTLTSTPTRLVTTTVAPGKYAVVASTVVFNSSGTGEPLPFASCTLKAGRVVLDQRVRSTLDQATTVTLLAVGSFTKSTKISVACADPTGFASLTTDYTRLQATQLGTLRRPLPGTSKTVQCPTGVWSSPCAIELQSSAATAIGVSDTPVAALNLGAGSYTMIGRVTFAATSSGNATVECSSDNGVIGLSDGTVFMFDGKTGELTLDTSFTVGPDQPVEVTCALRSGSQATVDGVRLTIVRVAQLVTATTAAKARCPVKPTTVPCAITAFGGAAALTSTHTVDAEANVKPGNYAISAAVSIESDDPAGGLHSVDCALVSGVGEFGGAFEVVAGRGATLFMLAAHRTTAADVTLSCADDSNSGQLTVTEAEITATRVGTLFSAGH